LAVILSVSILLIAAIGAVAIWRIDAGRRPTRPSIMPSADRSTPGPANGKTVASAPTTTTWVPSSTAPLRVLDIGDSLGIDLGWQLQAQWPKAGTVTVTMVSQGDTGLANPGFYDWPAQLPGFLASTHAQVVVVLLGANDDQGMDVNGAAVAFGTPAWQAAYAERVMSILQEAWTAGARVVWVSTPAMANPSLNASVALIDQIAAAQVARYPEDLYLDANTVLAPGGQFTFTAPGPADAGATTRTSDGVHLTAAGASLLVGAIDQAVAAAWHIILPS
jgi:hypothetical protein